MGLANGEEEKDERLPYLPGLGQGEKLAEDEELVADLSSEASTASFHGAQAWLIMLLL